MIKHDHTIDSLCYGNQTLPKETIIRDRAHPVKLCVAAFLLGLFYQLHLHDPENGEQCDLLPLSEHSPFYLISIPEECFQHPQKLTEILDPQMHLSLIDYIRTTNRHSSAEPEHVPSLNLPENGNIFLHGHADSGKTTYLLEYCSNQTNTVTFFLKLKHYRLEMHERIDMTHSVWILLQILLKYRYHSAYSGFQACAEDITESKLIQEMRLLNAELSGEPFSSPQFCLILDGLNEAPYDAYHTLLSEIEWISEKWKNTRIILSGRTVPQNKLFNQFVQIELTAEKKADTPMHALQVQAYLNRCYAESRNRADEMMHHFIVQIILPFIGFYMVHNSRNTIERADIANLISEAIALYIDNERIYQNYTTAQEIRKDQIQQFFNADRIIDMILQHICCMKPDIESSQILYFSDTITRNYFAAMYILNAIDALDSAYHSYDLDETEQQFERFHLGEIWFPTEETEAYKMVGELAGDDQNIPCAEFCYHRTRLDLLLQWSREFDTFRLSENVITAMASVRKNTLCGVDFHDVQLLIWIPAYIKFSDNGHDPCRFESSRFGLLGLYDGEILYRYSDDHSCILLHWSEDAYTITFDLKTKQMLAEYTNVDTFEGFPVSELDKQLFKELMGNLPHFRNCNLSVASFLCSQSNFHHI